MLCPRAICASFEVNYSPAHESLARENRCAVEIFLEEKHPLVIVPEMAQRSPKVKISPQSFKILADFVRVSLSSPLKSKRQGFISVPRI